MEEKFEYGELVEVRKSDNKPWVHRYYVGTILNCAGHYTMPVHHDPSSFRGDVTHWKQIRKIQKPEPGLIDIEQPETIEQRMDKFEAILNGAIKHINKQLDSIKKQLT